MPISAYINTPIPLFLKRFCHGIGNDRVWRETAVPAGAQRNCWAYIEHGTIPWWIGACLFSVCFAPCWGAFVIYAFVLHA